MSEILKIITMQDIAAEEIRWLWKPYIPFGKITIIQGDGGDGKTTFILAIAAAISKGILLPESTEIITPSNVIYQTAEDGLADTIKPRLLSLDADCSRVLVIDESDKGLTLSDTRIEQAITHTGAKLFVLDPLQAYLGADVDMHRANEVRPVFKQLGAVAERTGCAVVIVGHLNKGGNKSQYRGLGSVDIFAAARSVLTLGRVKDKPTYRAFAHGKSNLAPEGSSIAFELNPETGFHWIGAYPISIDELLSGSAAASVDSVLSRAVAFLESEILKTAVPANELYSMAEEQGISARTLRNAKSSLDARSFKQDNKWFWTLAPKNEKEEGKIEGGKVTR